MQRVNSRKSYYVGESKGKKTSAAADKAKQADKKAPSAAKDKDKGGKLSKEVCLNHENIYLFCNTFVRFMPKQCRHCIIPDLCSTSRVRLEKEGTHKMSRAVRKPAFCICENKDADQLRGDREADQRLCFHYIDSTFPLLPKYEISSL